MGTVMASPIREALARSLSGFSPFQKRWFGGAWGLSLEERKASAPEYNCGSSRWPEGFGPKQVYPSGHSSPSRAPGTGEAPGILEGSQ